jgi:hypothetical protein
VHRGMSKREERDLGASMVIMDIRYIWSAIDSPGFTLNRRHPSLGVVLSRSMRCRKGIGDAGCDEGERLRSVLLRTD